MMDWILSHETALRFGAYGGVLTAMAGAEALWPRRQRSQRRAGRWLNNLGIAALNSLLLTLIFPLLAVGLALIAADRGWGLFNLIAAPVWLEVLLAIVILDFIIWAQHLMFHKIGFLWRFHAMHHIDLDIDTTTGVRFHPVEILLSMLIKFGAVVLLGPAAVAVLLFEVLLNATALFNHANLRLPARLDRTLRAFMVTPDMHRVHHSVHQDETDSNYGFNLSVWDRIFGTYRAQPRDGHLEMAIGLDERRRLEDTLGVQMVLIPWTLGKDRS